MIKKVKLCLEMFILLIMTTSCVTTPEKITHRFVATDESGKQLLYVDQNNPENDWTIPLPGNRDIQISATGSVLVSVPSGYREYALKDGSLIKDIKVGSKNKSLIRLPNGHTLVAGDAGVVELDENDRQVGGLEKQMGRYFRVLRLTSKGNYLYTSGATTIAEMTPEGKEIRSLDLSELTPDTQKPYFIEELSDGRYMIATGYGATLLIVDETWKLIKSFGGKDKLKEFKPYFFSDCQQLKNGNFVVAHWSGHRREDSKKAPQLIEFDKNGKIVWSWHDPERAGTLHGIEIIE